MLVVQNSAVLGARGDGADLSLGWRRSIAPAMELCKGVGLTERHSSKAHLEVRLI